MPTEDVAADANRLYWESELSVSAIAEKLGISRRALYEALEPEASGVGCPDCGQPLAYANRSAQLAGEAQCVGCGLEADVPVRRKGEPAVAPAASARAASILEEPEAEQEEVAGPSAPLDLDALALRERAVMIGGAALAGIVIGALAAFVAKKR